MSEVTDNFVKIQSRLHEASIRSGRNPDSIKLIVVTKNQPAWKINEVIQAGATRLGENYPEQLEKKIREVTSTDQVEWHMIGHLQSRKIKYIVDYFSMVHSIETIETAKKLNNALIGRATCFPFCIEVNISGESTKNGFAGTNEQGWKNIVDFVNNMKDLKNIKPVGIMVMPPFTTNGETSRIFFKKAFRLQNYITQNSDIQGFCELSMGTSTDFEVAVEEGATMVRVGEAIMGSRII